MLTKSDWEEIYYAVDGKMRDIMAGKYGPEDEPGQDGEWVAHLNAILEKIGPDGKRMVA